jgi:uncharacterized SAM-binding protein YcdF (DUF218 family)
VGRRRFLPLRVFLAFVLLAALLFLTRTFWLSMLGRGLIHDDGPAKADLAVVLAGEYNGYRIQKAATLVRDGFVPAILVSGPADFYGLHESDLAIPFAIHKGFPGEWFIGFPHNGLSTKEEAADILAELARRNVHSFLLVTSNYHSARAGRIFRAAERARGGGPSMRVVAAPDRYFSPDGWWRNREGQKTAFFEWCKTFATALGM